jgi:hypothetical protein
MQPLRCTSARIAPLGLAVMLCLAAQARAQTGPTFTASAKVTTAAGVTSTAPVSVMVDRFSTDADRDEIMAAIKYVYERTTPEGRLVTAVTGSVIAYVGGAAPGAKPKSGFYLGLVILVVPTTGAGHGEMSPATKVRLDDKGAIVTDGYSDDVVQLTNVVRK